MLWANKVCIECLSGRPKEETFGLSRNKSMKDRRKVQGVPKRNTLLFCR